MFTYECLLVTALMSCPKETHFDAETAAWAEASRPTLLALALDAEILDARERDHYLTQASSRKDDFEHLQAKYQQLLSVPVLTECARFPSRQVINEYLSSNRAFRAEMQKRMVIDPVHNEELRLAIYEIDQLYQVWDTLRDARCDYYYVTVRRQALQNLREMVGSEAFYRGIMPPHIPTWHVPVQR